MSRSFKSNPIIKDNRRGRKKSKRQASKKVRKYKGEISDGQFYKKLYNTWDIYDYVSHCTYEEWKTMFYKNDSLYTIRYYNNEKDCYNDWARFYKRK